jgi:hypothetical protein
MADEPENLTLTLLRDIRSDIAKMREDMREGFERVDEQIAEVKSEVIKCRKEVADADWVAKGVAVRLTWKSASRRWKRRGRKLERAHVGATLDWC